MIEKLMRGERPEGMDFEEFKIKRKAIQKFIKKYLRGRRIQSKVQNS